MTVASTTNKVIFTGNGVASAFAYSFLIFADTDLVVTELVIATGVETVLTITTDYTVSGVSPTVGGTVTLVAGALPSTKKLTIQRVLPLTQLFDLVENDNAPSASFETAFDRLVMITQQLDEVLDRAIKVDATQTNVDVQLPAPVANKGIGWSSDGLSLVNDPADFAATVAAAAASEAAASNSAATAASASVSATASANTAITQANSATASASSASSSQSAAAASAVSAASEAALAAVSETNASTSETNASNSANSASTSASNASTSASNASTSETNASNSASAASTSETNAATSETNAATSETNAAASAAGVNLPSLGAGDAGKALKVNSAEDGYELTSSFGSSIANGTTLVDCEATSIDFDISGTEQITLIDGVLQPTTDDDVDLGASGNEFKDLWIDGIANIDTLKVDALGANMDCANFNFTNVDIDSGAIDGVTIGANSAPTVTDLGSVATCDINGGTMDGVQVDGATATGVLFVNDASDDLSQLGDGQGTSGEFLQSAGAGAEPIWATPAGASADEKIQAWIRFGMNDGTIDDSFNITSVSDGGVGLFTVTIATDFADGNYSAVGTDDFRNTQIDSHVAGSLRVQCFNSSENATDSEQVSIIMSGDQ